MGRRGFALESAAARVCREAGARVSVNQFVRDLDIAAPNAADTRRLEVVADGLPLFHGAHLAIDTTMVSPLSREGFPKLGCAEVDGAALTAARRRKERRYPELVCEVGGRFAEECRHFLRQLSKAKVRSEPPLLQQRVRHAWSSFDAPCWLAQAHVLSRCPCWRNAAVKGWTAPLLPVMM